MKRLSKLIIIFLILICASAAFASYSQSENINIYVDGRKIFFPDQRPFVNSSGKVLVPLRFVSETLGADVEWNALKQRVNISHDSLEIILDIVKPGTPLNGNVKGDITTLDNPVVITYRNRVVVPIRFVSECLGAYVYWNPHQKEVHIYTDDYQNPAPLSGDVVIYGGSFAGCAAARQAAGHLPEDRNIIMIVPESALGSIGTTGGQNFFDIRKWQGKLVTQGNFLDWFNAFGQGYPTESMANLLYSSIIEHNKEKVKFLFGYEIEEVSFDKSGKTITGLTVRPVRRDLNTLAIRWSGKPRQVFGSIFIDASDTGRLSRLSGIPLSPGRADWSSDGHQQAAGLMFKVTDIDHSTANSYRNPTTGNSDFYYFRDLDGSMLGWGGSNYIREDPVIVDYNDSSTRFSIKGYNIAEDSPGEWWLNILLIHGVNGMMQEIDRNTSRWPHINLIEDGQISTDQAYRMALEELESPQFIKTLRSFPGFENLELVYGADGRPTAGEILYLRETAHAVNQDGTFALTADAVRNPASKNNRGADSHLYSERIGLGLYYIDINGYKKGEPIQTLEQPPSPHYIPFSSLISPAVDNILIPGYAQSTSSEAWASMRVIPNLAVCGDAAGVIAAYSIITNKTPSGLNNEQLSTIQNYLISSAILLDK